MSFGFSIGDCILLLQIARTQYKNCVSAGPEYTEIAREVKSLYSILKILKEEAEKPNSPLLRHDEKSTEELLGATEGCRHILEDLQTLLAKYEGLSGDGEAVSGTRKLWHKMKFGTKIQQLGDVRGKIITYTTTISVLLDAIQLKATGRLEDKVDTGFTNVGDKVDNGFANVMDGFLSMKRVIVEEVLKARSQPRGRSTISLLSLSTYNEDNKEVWQEFRRELVVKGFNSRKLDRYRDVLMAYILKLEQNGVLEKLAPQTNEQAPWWTQHAFLETTDTLLAPNLQPIVEETKHLPEPNSAANAKIPLPTTNAASLGDNLLPTRGGTRSAREIAAAGIAGAAIAQLYETRQGRDIRSTGDEIAAKAGLYDIQRTEKERFPEAGYRNFPGLAHDQGALNKKASADVDKPLKDNQQETLSQFTPTTPLPPGAWPEHEDAVRAQEIAKAKMGKRRWEKKKKNQLATSFEEANTELSQGTAAVAQPIKSTVNGSSHGSDSNKTQSPNSSKEHHPAYASETSLLADIPHQISSNTIPNATNTLASTKASAQGNKVPEVPEPTDSESEILASDAVGLDIRGAQTFVIKEQDLIKTPLKPAEEKIETEPSEIRAPIFNEDGPSATNPNSNKFAYAESVAESDDDSRKTITGNEKLPLDQPKSNIEEKLSQKVPESAKWSLETGVKSSKDQEDVSVRQGIPDSTQPSFKPRDEARSSYTSKREPDISPSRSPKVRLKPQVRYKPFGVPAGVEGSSGSRKVTNSRNPRVIHTSDSEDSLSDEKLKKEARKRQSRTTVQLREERRKRREQRKNTAAADGSSYFPPRERFDDGNNIPDYESRLPDKKLNTNVIEAGVLAGVLAAAAEVFRTRKEPSGWEGEQRKRILKALEAAAVRAEASVMSDDERGKESRNKPESYPGYESDSYYSEYTDTEGSEEVVVREAELPRRNKRSERVVEEVVVVEEPNPPRTYKRYGNRESGYRALDERIESGKRSGRSRA